jgi:hypothetical protein
MNSTSPPLRPEPDRSYWVLFALSAALSLVGFFFQSDLGYDDDPVVTSYAVSLGETCEADIGACEITPLPPVGYRVEDNP